VPVEDHECYEKRDDGFHLVAPLAEEVDRYDREMAAKDAELAATAAQLLKLLARREMRAALSEANVEPRFYEAVQAMLLAQFQCVLNHTGPGEFAAAVETPYGQVSVG